MGTKITCYGICTLHCANKSIFQNDNINVVISDDTVSFLKGTSPSVHHCLVKIN